MRRLILLMLLATASAWGQSPLHSTTPANNQDYPLNYSPQAPNANGPADDNLDNTITAARTYYVCAKANGGTCIYNGDAGTVAATIADSNDCLTKATPCRTPAGVQAKISGKRLSAVVTIQFANDADTGTDVYQPADLTFSNSTLDGPNRTIWDAGMLGGDVYPASYIYLVGDTTTPTNVVMDGASVVGGTTPNQWYAFECLNTNCRVSGMVFRYFDKAPTNAGGPTSAAFYCLGGKSDCYLDGPVNIIDSGNNTAHLFTVANQARGHEGGTINLTNAGALWADSTSVADTKTPTAFLTLNVLVGTGTFTGQIFEANMHSAIIVWGPYTMSFLGTSAYTAFNTQDHSHIATSENPNVGTSSMTFNNSAMTIFQASSNSSVIANCGGSGNTCTFTAYAKHSNVSQNGLVLDNTTAQTTGDATASLGCIVYSPSSSPVYNCSERVFKSSSTSVPALVLQMPASPTVGALELPKESGVSDAGAGRFQLAGDGSVIFRGDGTNRRVFVEELKQNTIPNATNASISATTIGTWTADTTFRASFYVTQVDTGTGCTTGATVQVNLIFTDAYTNTAYTITVPLQTSGNIAFVTALTLSTSAVSASTVAWSIVPFRAKASTNVQFSTTYTNGASCSTQPNYRIVPNLEVTL